MIRNLILDVIQYITKLVKPGRTILVAIDGGAGAGKTTFTRWFAERIRENGFPVSIVLTDRIYRLVAERWQGSIEDMPIGYDLDWERIRDQIILPLRDGETARFQLYDWVNDCLNEWVEIEPRGVTIMDGVFSLRNELVDYYDLRIWFSCPQEIRVSRLLNRGDTPGVEIDAWIPMEKRYHTGHDPENSADLVVDSSENISLEDGNAGLKVIRWSPPGVPQHNSE